MILFFGCENQKSEFKVSRDYSEFTTQMNNNDTLNIEVILSICAWSEFDQLQLTKSSDSIYIQLIEKRVMNKKLIHFDRIVYNLKHDTLNLEKMMTSFDINHQQKINSPFFIIINPKEKDTILLRTTGLENREFNIRRYQKIMAKLYPKEMAEYKKEYSTPPPPSDIKSTKTKIE